MKEIKNILVAVDFSESDEELLDYTISLASKFGSMAWIVHVAAPQPDFVGYEVGPQYVRDSRAGDLRKEHKTLRSYAEQLRKKSVAAEGLLIEGYQVEMILAEAEKLKIDLFITGKHHHNFLYRLFTGDTAEQIIRRTHIPILIVPSK